ncbi:MAG: hypothetical protein AAGH57_02115 [Pseudomonadota bacterium]
MTRIIAIAAATLATLSLAACNAAANFEEAQQQVEIYQSHFSNGELDEMYAMYSLDYRQLKSLEEFGDTIASIKTRLGSIETTQQQGLNITTTLDGTVTTVIMQTQFEQGEGTETYTFVGPGEEMAIYAWNVSSDRLLITPDEMKRLDEAPTALEPAD